MADIINFLDRRKNSKYGRNPLEPRIEIPRGNLSTTLLIDGGKELKGEIHNISAGGLALLIDSLDDEIERGSEIEKITINAPTGDIFETDGHITHITPEIKDKDYSHVVGLGFKRKESPTLDKLTISKEDRQFDILKSTEEMTRIFEDMLLIGEEAKIAVKLDEHSFTEGRFKRANQLKKTTSFMIDFDSDEYTMNFEVEKEFTFFFTLFKSFYIFRAIILANTGRSIEVAIPDFFVKLMRRTTSRIPARDLGEVFIDIDNPFIPGKSLRKAVLDMNEDGFSILVGKGEFVFPVGTSLHQMKIELPDNEPIKTFGRLVHIEPWQTANVYKCGIKFFEKDREKLKTIADYVFFKRFSLLSPKAKLDYQSTWNIFDKSGYLDEKPRESFELVREESNPTWEKMDSTNGYLTRNIASTDGEKVTGCMHLSRVYENSFLLHHFCIYPGYQRTVTTSVYGGMIDQLLDSGAKYTVCYYNADKAWNDKNYGEFIKSYPYKDENYNKTYDLFEFDITGDLPMPFSTDKFSIQEANDFDIKGISRFFEMNRKKIQIEAMDLSLESLKMQKLGSEYAKAGLERGRNFFIAKKGKEMTGFAMLDITSTGVNIYALMDSFRIYLIDPKDPDRENIIKALTLKALEYFRSIGKKTILYYSNDSDIKFLSPLKYQRLCTIVLWIAHRNCFARYSEYNGALFGRIIARRMRIREKISKENPSSMGN